MLTYNGSSYTWMGRELRKITNGSNTYSYKYNADGIRTSKTVNGTTTEFFLNGSQVLAQKTGDSVMRFFYDSTGKRVGFANGTMLFYYLYNLQGDVIAIVRAATGQVVAKYTYDAWGNCTVTNAAGYTVGDKNPFRYRGYYYDTETGLYYLNSRYYNPEFGRFISADGFVSIGQGITGSNMFAYCGNNPINRYDSNGMIWEKIGGFLKGIGTAIASFAEAFFGAESLSYITTAKAEVTHIPDPLPITAKAGVKTTQTMAKHGDSSKPISVYTKTDISHPVKSSSAGLKFNLGSFSLDIGIGLNNAGIKGSIKNGNTTNSFGLKLNLSELKLGFESTASYKWDNMTQTTYTNVDVSGWALVVAYGLFNSGQLYDSSSSFYGY